MYECFSQFQDPWGIINSSESVAGAQMSGSKTSATGKGTDLMLGCEGDAAQEQDALYFKVGIMENAGVILSWVMVYSVVVGWGHGNILARAGGSTLPLTLVLALPTTGPGVRLSRWVALIFGFFWDAGVDATMGSG